MEKLKNLVDRDFWGITDRVLRAEIYLLLAGLDARISYSAIETMAKILLKIDKDSQILKGISLNVGFGLGQYYHDMLVKQINASMQ